MSSNYRLRYPALSIHSTNFIEPTAQKTSDRHVPFLDASERTEKTNLINAIQNWLNLRGKSVIVVGTSAVAAEPVKGARIAHSAFKTLVPGGANDTCHISVDYSDAQKL